MPPIPINIADHVGSTPMVRLTRLLPAGRATCELYGKLEAFNPGGSVKDRIGVAMIEAAERDGQIEPGRTTIVEATSRQHRHRARVRLRGQGLRPRDLPAAGHEPRARGAAEDLRRARGDRRVAGRHERGRRRARRPRRARPRRLPARPVLQPGQPRGPPPDDGPGDPARRSTDRVDVFVGGVGTGGTITGVGRGDQGASTRDAQSSPSSRAPAPCSPAAPPGPHRIQGIGAGLRARACSTVDSSTRSSPVPDEDGDRDRAPRRRARGHPRRASPAARRCAAALQVGRAARVARASGSWPCCPTPASATSPRRSSRR